MELIRLTKTDFFKALRNIGWILLAIFGLLILLLAALGITLSFSSGRVSLAEFALNQADKRLDNLKIEYSDIASPAINEWRLGSLKVFREGKLWIEVEDFNLAYAIQPIFDKEIIIRNLGASSIEYHHQELGGTQEPKKETQSGWQESQWHYAIEDFDVDRLSLENLPLGGPDQQQNGQQQNSQQQAGLQQSSQQPKQLPDYSLRGSVDLFGSGAPLKLSLDAKSLPPEKPSDTYAAMRIDINSTVNADASATITGTLQEEAGKEGRAPQGIIGRTLKLPVNQEVDLNFTIAINKIDSTYLIAIKQLEFPFQRQTIKANGKLLAAFDPLKIQVEDARIDTGEQTHTISGELAGNEVSADVSLNEFPLALVSYWVPEIEGGSLSSQTHIDGTLDKPDVRTQSELQANWRGKDHIIDVTARVDGSYQSQTLRLKNFDASLNEAHATAQGEWDMAKQIINMRVRVNSLSYNLVNSLTSRFSLPPLPDTRVTLNNAEAELTGSTADKFAHTTVDADIDADLVYQQQPISLKGRAQGSLDKWNINALRINSNGNEIVAQGIFDLYGTDNALQVDIDPVAVDFLRKLELPVPPELNGNLNGSIALSGAIKNPAVKYQLKADLTYPIPNAQAQLKNEDLALAASGNWSDNAVEVDNLSITYAGYSEREPILDASGRITLGKKIPGMNWTVNSSHVPMSLLAPYGWPDDSGQLSLDLNVTVPPTETIDSGWFESVMLDGDAFYSTKIANPSNRKVIQPVEWSMQLNSRKPEKGPPVWIMNSEVSLPRQKDNGNGNNARSGWLTVQVQPESLYRFFGNRNRLPEVNMEAELDVASLSFLWPDDHRVTGKFKTDLTLSGSLDAPQIDGPITFNNGTYVNEALGLYFSDITLDSVAENKVLEIKSINAVGRDNGKLDGSGRINWSEPDGDRAILLDINAKQFNLVQRRDIEGQVSADLQLAGNFKRLVLSGEIEVSPFEVSIAGNPGPEIPEIDYEYASEEEENAEAEQGGVMPTLILDLTVTVDQQAYIRGRGLEAELEGNIDLEGPVSDLHYEGEFKTVRGEFVVFGKRFELQQGEVGFNNQSTVLLVDGLYKKDEAEIRAQLSGAGNDLKLKLTSVPPLPEDEILARLIFGKSAQEMTPIQALQLARAVRTLQGGGGGFDPIGSTREMLGVDTLTVEAGKSGVEVGAGKYISDDVYLELERSSDPAHPWQGNVLIELTPNISLESTTGGSGQQGASAKLMWKKDY